ncbi:Atu4866 domain-containing protein [Nocardiopsis lambiniae]|uniref:Atu4866 domain-containing protein n=1 Tax=Nocardiopsis lambiniae TaxID=3075539 RepID=A0ABU2M9G9_9ACTN|nr:Atu4866 domain-containing protein [Nocardiopsis sp. DSM 44743]MDT0329326.1 Atu4866 domain-containing protein [Nocardiopsis sp. DSM 44743]
MGITEASRPRREDAVSARAREPEDRPLLLTGGTVITGNPLMGDWERADVLIGGEVVVGVGPGLLTAAEDDDMIVIDCAGTVVLPASVDLTGKGVSGTLTPGERADVAVYRIADAPGTPPGAVPFRGGHRDLLVIGGRIRDATEVPDGSGPAAAPWPEGDARHPYTGTWVTEDGFIRQELSADGRYDEGRGERESAYTGRYRVGGNRIDYLDDLGFWAFGEFHDGVLHHAGYRFTRR